MNRSLRRKTECLLVLAGLISMAAAAGSAPPGANAAGAGRPVFWVGANHNEAFDRQIQKYIAGHAGIAILNLNAHSMDGPHGYRAIISAIHAMHPGLPVLLYGWGTRWVPGVTIGPAIGSGYQNLGSKLFHKPDGKPETSGRYLFANVADPGYRAWYADRVRRYIALTGANGIALDMMQRTPAFMQSPCRRKSQSCRSYRTGVEALLKQLTAALRPGAVIFNGLWNIKPGQLQDQEALLPYATGAAVEYFGRRPNKTVLPFSRGIQPFLEIIKAHPHKTFLVFGRGALTYADYRQDYSWQRYLYCAYLLVAGPNTHFHYHARFFEVPPTQFEGRAGGMAWYADWNVRLGAPLSAYELTGSLYSRRFANALVLLIPAGGQPSEYTLTGDWYTPEGRVVAGTITVHPGQGVLLQRAKPRSAAMNIGFGGADAPGSDWPDAKIEGSSALGKYLALTATAPASVWQHDLMLDPVHALDAPDCIRFQLRTRDPSARMLLAAAVDDELHQKEQISVGLVTAAHEPAKPGGRDRGAVRFRVPGADGTKLDLVAKPRVAADGKWHPVNLCARPAFASQNRYTFAQWKFVRIVGAVDLGAIHLYRSGENASAPSPARGERPGNGRGIPGRKHAAKTSMRQQIPYALVARG